MSREYLYLIRYDLDLKNNNAKIIKMEEVEKTLKYLHFIKATNIEIYMVDFDNNLIGRVD